MYVRHLNHLIGSSSTFSIDYVSDTKDKTALCEVTSLINLKLMLCGFTTVTGYSQKKSRLSNSD